MREIKFRAWNGQGWVKDLNDPKGYVTTFAHWTDGRVDLWLNGPCVEQYTGLHDKNGREIYEGDIVMLGDEWSEKVRGPWEVKFQDVNGQWALEKGASESWHMLSWSDLNAPKAGESIEVIGNIHEGAPNA